MKKPDDKRTSVLNQICKLASPQPRLMLAAPSLLIGVGTSGSDVNLGVFNRINKAFGSTPPNTRFLLLDSDKDQRPETVRHLRDVGCHVIGLDGAGTNTARGKQMALKSYKSLVESLQKAISGLMESDCPRLPTNLSGSKHQNVFIAAGGTGGTSGGLNDLVVTSIYDAARKCGLPSVRNHVFLIGSEMPHLDVNRNVEPERIERMRANLAENLQHWYGSMSSKKKFTENPPQGQPFQVNASTRIHSLTIFDAVSPSRRLHRSYELHQLMSRCLFSRIFTAFGQDRDSRFCDEFINGYTGQVDPASGEIIESL